MPQIANLVVKKNDGTTDVTFTAIQPSAGDKAPAIWRNEAVGSAVAHRPTLLLTGRNNGTGTARRLEGQAVFPSTVTGADGRVTVADRLILSFNAVVPLGMPSAEVNEAVAQGLNLFSATLVKDSVKTGYAPS